MKVVYMGTPDFAVGPLKAMIDAGHEVVLVVTQPDKKKGRGKEMQFTPVKECALEHNIEVFQPVKIKDAQSVEVLRKYDADIFVVAAFGQILSKEILDMPKYGCINIHASLLPKYRGAAPIQWVIIDGEEETGVTIMQMDVGLDTGDMLLKKTVAIDKKETGETLHDKLSDAGSSLIVEALSLIEKGQITPEKQDDEKSCYAKMLTKELGLIHWDEPAEKIERLIRGLNSWPSAYTFLDGRTFKIWEADAIGCENVKYQELADANPECMKQPGTILEVTKEDIFVVCKESILNIKQLQLEGKKRMNTKEFLLGRSLSKGTQFSERR